MQHAYLTGMTYEIDMKTFRFFAETFAALK